MTNSFQQLQVNTFKYRYLLGTALFLLLFAVPSWLAWEIQVSNRQQLFRSNSHLLESHFWERINSVEAVGVSVSSLYYSTPKITEEIFTDYVGQLADRYPYLLAATYYKHIKHDQRAEYESYLRSTGQGQGYIFSTTAKGLRKLPKQDDYYTLAFMYPVIPAAVQFRGQELQHAKDKRLSALAKRVIAGDSTLISPGVFNKSFGQNHPVNFMLLPVRSKLEKEATMASGVIALVINPMLMFNQAELPDNYRIQLSIEVDSDSSNSTPLLWDKFEKNGSSILFRNDYQAEKAFPGVTIRLHVAEQVTLGSLYFSPFIGIAIVSFIITLLAFKLIKSIIATSAAQSINRTKNEFISTVSHELRTPLTSIHGSLGLIAGGAVGDVPEKALKLIEIASNNCSRLVRLINDILDIEKMEAGLMQMDRQEGNLSEIVRAAIETNKPYADKHKVEFVLEAMADTIPVCVDEDNIHQVMNNLLSNAAKFSPENGKVTIKVTHDKQTVMVSVRDHGKGIPKEFQSRIFGKFAQADASDTKQKGGTGLGLSICKAIIELHDGRIGYDSEKDKGSCFWFELALSGKVTARSVESPAATPARVQTTDTRNSEVSSANASAQSVASNRVLICEDDVDIASLLALILKQRGADVDIAHSAEEALKLLQCNQYQAMTLDIMLPGKSGLELMDELRNQGIAADMPVFIVSAVADAKQQLEGRQYSNIVEWLSKPIDPERLLASLEPKLQTDQQLKPVLHVEDDRDIHLLVQQSLAENVSLQHAGSLAEAKALLAREEFAAVLLDIGLPDGDGLHLIPVINHSQGEIPIIVFSAQQTSSDIASQVSSVFVKSRDDMQQLADKIAQHLKPEGMKAHAIE